MGRGDIRDQQADERKRGVTHASLARRCPGVIVGHRPIVRAIVAGPRLRPILGDAAARIRRFHLRPCLLSMAEFVWRRRPASVTVRRMPAHAPLRPRSIVHIDMHTHLMRQTLEHSRLIVAPGGRIVSYRPFREPAAPIAALARIQQERSFSETVIHRYERVDQRRAAEAVSEVTRRMGAAAPAERAPRESPPLVLRRAGGQPALDLAPSPRADATPTPPAQSSQSEPWTASPSVATAARRAPVAPAVNIERITDQVVRRLDQRVIAWRERTGRA